MHLLFLLSYITGAKLHKKGGAFISDISCSCHCLFLLTAKLCASYLPTVWFCPGALGTSFSRSPRQCSWQWTPYGSGGICVDEQEPEEEWWSSNSCKLKLQFKNLKRNDEVAVVVNWNFKVLKLAISRTRIKVEWCFILICKSTRNSQEPRKGNTEMKSWWRRSVI